MRRERLVGAVLGTMAMLLVGGTALEAQGRGGRHGLHIPPGHMPTPGDCRVWYIGQPPGHQPPAVPCGILRGYRFPGAVVVGAPLRAGGYGYLEDARDGLQFRLQVEWAPREVRRSQGRDVVRPARNGGRDKRGRGRH